MKVLIVSDIHDSIQNLQQILEQQKGQVQAMVCCGDICSPFTAAILSTAAVPTYACLGNNDEDHIGLLKQGGAQITWFNLADEFGVINLADRQIAFCHYPRLGELLAQSGEYAAVFHGHTHECRNELVDDTLLVNPGAVCGIVRGKPGPAGFAVYDTDTNTAQLVELH